MAAGKDLINAMKKMYKEGFGTDATLVCQGSRKAVHASVLMARSPFLRAKVERWSDEKREIVIEDCDPEILAVVVDYMYGIDLPRLVGYEAPSAKPVGIYFWNCSICKALKFPDMMCTCGKVKDGFEAPSDDEDIEEALAQSTAWTKANQMDCHRLGKVLEVTERFLMADLKAEIEKLSISIISKDNIKELCGRADKFGCKKLARACADFMVKNGICLDGEEVKQMPDVTAACLEASKKELQASNKRLEVLEKELEASKKNLQTLRRSYGYC